MAGSWLASLGKALTRPETFEKLVSPAIADLQREAPGGMVARARHYVALAAVMTCAVARDFRIDLAGAFDAGAARHVWMKAAVWALAFAGLAGWFGVREELMVLGPAAISAALTKASLGALTGAFFSVATTASAFYLVRRGSPTRTIVAVTLVLFLAALAAASAVHPIRMAADRELYARGQSLQTGPASSNTLLATWLGVQADEVEAGLTRGRDLRNALGVVNAAMLGIILAGSRRWKVPLTAALFMATFFVVGMMVIQLEMSVLRGVPSYAVQRWRDVGVTFVVACVWLRATRHARHGPLHDGDDPSGVTVSL